jgi:hypothetical protein
MYVPILLDLLTTQICSDHSTVLCRKATSTRSLLGGILLIVSGFTVLLNTIDLRYQTLPALITLAQEELPSVVDQIPETAVFRYADGTLRIENTSLPLLLQTPKKLLEKGVPQTLVQAFDAQTLAVLNLKESEFQLRFPLDGTWMEATPMRYREVFQEDFSFTKSQLAGRVEEILTALPLSATLLLLLCFPFLWLAGMFSTLLAIAIYVIVVALFSPLIGIRFTRKSLLKLGLTVGAVSSFIDALVQLLYSDLNVSLLSIAFFGIVALVCFEIRKNRIQYTVS